MDWLDLLPVHGTLKSLLQHHNSKASILQCSAVFTVQLAHPYMTTGKTIALTNVSAFDTLIFVEPIIEFLICNALNFRETKILRYKMYIAKLVTTANANNVVVSLNFHIDYNKGV